MNRYYGANVETVPGSNSRFASHAFCLQEFFKLRHRKIESGRIDIDKNRLSADSNNRTGGAKEGKRRGNDGVSRSDSQGHQNEQLRVGPGGCAYAEFRSGQGSNPLFKFFYFRSEDKGLRVTDLRQIR